MGQPGPRRRGADHPRGARRGDQLRRHGRRLLERRVRGDRRQGAQRTSRRRRARDEGPRAPWAAGQNRSGNSRRWIRYEVEQSLRRLGTDWIDLYQIHRPDPRTDIEETLSVLTDLIREGKVRAIGCSTFPAELIVEAHWAADRRGLERFRCEQPPYSLFARGIETGVLPVCERYGMGVITWSPLASGWLSGQVPARHDDRHELGPRLPHSGALRPEPARQPAQARPRRRARGRRRARPGCRSRTLRSPLSSPIPP